jgi:CubicO group peptidase (beta-lactamase class C family)
MRAAHTIVSVLGAAALLAVACGRPASVAPVMTDAIRADNARALPEGAEDVSALLEPLRVKYDLPALGAAVVTSSKIEALGVTGVRKAGDPTPARITDPFHLGSDGKAMTAFVVAKAIESGKLSWTSTIGQVLASVPMRAEYTNVTVEQLLAHRAGLSHDLRTMNVNEVRRIPGTVREKRDRYVATALSEEPAGPPGTKMLYSNAGYVIAAAMAERALGADYETLLPKIVWEPLAMRGAGFGAAGQGSGVLAPWPHRVDSLGDREAIEPDWSADNPVAVNPAGNMHMPMEAWSRFVMEILRGLTTTEERAGAPLSHATLETLFSPHLGGDYFAGWSQLERTWAGGTAFTHSGSNTMNYALAWVAPKKDVAFLVATNQADTKNATFLACDAVVVALTKHRQERPQNSPAP